MADEAKKDDDAKPDTPSYEPLALKGHKFDRQMRQIRFSPCGEFVLAAGFDGQVRRLNVSEEEPRELSPLAGHGGWVEAITFGPEDTVFVADSWGGLRAWRFKEESPSPAWTKVTAHDGWIQDVTISPDGKQLATCGSDGFVRVWNSADGEMPQEFAGHNEVVFRCRFHPDGKSLVSGDLKGIVKQWELATGNVTREFDAKVLHKSHRLQEVGGVRSLAFNVDGSLLGVGGTLPDNGGNVQGNPLLLLFDWASGTMKEQIQFGDQNEVYLTDFTFLPGELVLGVTSGGPGKGKMLIQKLGEKEPLFASNKIANCHSLSLHLPSRRFAVSSTNTGSNGNGRRLNKDGEYEGNHAPLHLFQLPEAVV